MFDRVLFRFARSERAEFLILIACAVVLGVLILGQAWLLSLVIARVFIENATLASVLGMVGLLAVLVLLRAGVGALSEIAASRIAITIKGTLRRQVYEHIVALGPVYATSRGTGELTTTLMERIEALDGYFSQYLPQLIAAALVPLCILLFVLPLDLLSGVALILTAPLIPFFMILIGKSAEALSQKQFTRLARLRAYFLDMLQGMTTLKLLNQSRNQAAGVQRAGQEYAEATLAVLRVAFLSALVLELVATLSTAIIAVEIGLRVLYGQLGFQPALFVLILAPEFYVPLRLLGLRYHAATAGATAIQQVMTILNTPLPPRAPNARRISRPEIISVRDVQYRYDEARVPLRGVSFEIRRGETVALFGASGAGKSTIAQLLLGLLQPTGGEIRVNDIPFAELDLEHWRSHVGWVSQKPHLLHTSIAANIALARPDASRDDIEQAARRAHLHAFITTLPQGYETVVGESGARLSGGEAQRLALARAFLKDAPFLILDEPTSNLDPETETLLQESTAALMRGRTVLVIAHRLATIYRADRIVVLEQGRVVEMGTHAELLRHAGAYRDMVFRAGVSGT